MMSVAAIRFFVILIIVVGIGLYIYNSGVLGKGFSALNSFSFGTSTSPGPAPIYSSGAPSNSAGTTYVPPTSIPPSEIPSGFTASELSPYFHEIRFGGVSAGTYGQVSLYAYQSQGTASIDVTGWEVKGNRGGFYIPQAVNLYDPLGLTPASNIWLKSGDVLDMYSTSAPVNLRLNECIGYLPNRSQFNPQLPQNCPYIDRSQIQSFTGACQNYIQSLGGCQEANLANPSIPINDDACRTYLVDNFNYRSCFESHQADSNFLSNQVWAWMGSSPFDQYHDNIELVDRNGLLVDLYSY